MIASVFRMQISLADPRSGRIVTLVLLSLSIVGSWPLQAAAKGPKTPTYRVRVEFWNRTGDGVQSVGAATYTDGELNASGQIDVDATMTSSTGGLVLTTLQCSRTKGWESTCLSLGRYHFFDFSQPVDLVNPLPTTNGWANGTISAGASFMTDPVAEDGVTRLPNGFRDLMNVPGEQRLSTMKVNFTDSAGSPTFTLRFTPNSYPESNYLLVTYLGGSLSCGGSTACASWTVEALDGPVDPVTCVSCAKSNVEAIAVLQGYGAFHTPFKITISVLPSW